MGVPHMQPLRWQLSPWLSQLQVLQPLGGGGTPKSSCLPLPEQPWGMRGKAVDGGGKDREKASWGGLGSRNWELLEKQSEIGRGEGKNIRSALGQAIFQYASVQGSCQATSLNSCSPTVNKKTVLFASGFQPRAVSTTLLLTGTGTYSPALTLMGRLELARGGWGHHWPCVGGTPCTWDTDPLHTTLCTWPQSSKTEVTMLG